MTPPADTPPRSRLPLVAVALVVAAGIVLRFVTRSDLWLDEALSVNIARLPLGDIPDWLRHDGAPPLYYVLLHGWTGLFGAGDVAARSLSGVCSVGALVAAWFAARQAGGSRFALTTLVLLAVNPFALRYATEARMYSLIILLVFCGMIATRRAWADPSAGNLALVALVTALLLYTQYWALYLLVVVGGLLVLGFVLRADLRARTVRIAAAVVVGGLTFVPWLPTFLYQRAHTGTPWGAPVLPGLPTGQSLLEFAGSGTQEGWLLFLPVAGLIWLGVFGATRADGVIEIRPRGGVPNVTVEAIIGIATIFVGASLSYVGKSAFQPRYAAVALPFFVFVLAAGVERFSDRRLHAAVLAVLCVGGLLGGVRSVKTNRTQAGAVAAVLQAEARPGDVVLYCPDQLGPAVHRLAPAGLVERTDPPSPDPGVLVDWVDYTEAIAARSPEAVARDTLELAGDHTIWVVSSPGYTTHTGRCETIERLLARERDETVRVIPDDDVFEHPGLQEFRAR